MPTHAHFFQEAAKEARKAPCHKDKCGAVVVLKGKIIGRGFNGPAGGNPQKCKCHLNLVESAKPKSDRTCCVHAEWRAMIGAIKAKKDLSGGVLYFSRVDDEGNFLKSGDPYCTVCSRLALECGLSKFGLWQRTGMRLFDTDEYNELSYTFHQKTKPRNKAIPAVYLILEKDGKILMSKRRNTGYMDGKYQLPAGHVEAGEVPTEALIREAKEEVGIILKKESLEFVHVSYRPKHDNTDNRVDYLFRAVKWKGRIRNTEPHKCMGWEWIDPKKLPKKIIPHLTPIISGIYGRKPFTELGYDWLRSKGLI